MQAIIRTYVRSAYDFQSLRVQMGNRVIANFKVKLGQEAGQPEEEMSAESKTLLADLRASHKKLADAMPKQVKNFVGDALITSFAEFSLISSYLKLEEDEAKHFKDLEKILQGVPVYTEFLEGVRGVGPAIAGVIISEIDPHKMTYPSSLWKYAGLDVAYVQNDKTGVQEWQGRSRKANHLVTRDYLNSKGEAATRQSITFNPFLKTKLIGVLGSSFLLSSRVLVDDKNTSSAKRLALAVSKGFDPKSVCSPEMKQAVINYLRAQGHTVVMDSSPYQVAYENYKNRLNNDPRHKDKNDKHKHNMAVRYMVKRFLVDLYKAWRPLEGLPVAPEYSEAKLGMIHGEVKRAA